MEIHGMPVFYEGVSPVSEVSAPGPAPKETFHEGHQAPQQSKASVDGRLQHAGRLTGRFLSIYLSVCAVPCFEGRFKGGPEHNGTCLAAETSLSVWQTFQISGGAPVHPGTYKMTKHTECQPVQSVLYPL
eukprot:50195-Pelagomonas_calceolata.AAC.1